MAEKKEEGPKGFELFYVAVASAWLGSVAMGTNLGYSSPAIPSLKSNITDGGLEINDSEETWFGSLMTLGALTGGLVAGFLVDSLGRKLSIIFSSLGFIAGWVLIATAGTVVVLCLGRVITGFFTGLVSLAVPVYVSEISRPQVRGTLGTGIQLSVTIGILGVFFFGKFLSWSSLAILCLTLPSAMAVLMIFMAESPRWLMQKGKREDALKALQFLYAAGTDYEGERNNIEVNLKMSSSESFHVRELRQPFIYKPILISLFLMFAQQMSGINAVMFYAVSIFQSAGTTIPPEDCMVIIGVVQVIATLGATMVMDKGGRRVLLLTSAALLALSLGVLGGYHYVKATKGDEAVESIGWLPLVCLSLFIIGFSCGMGPIPWLMMGELLPARVRGFATGICTSFNWTMAFVVTKTFNDMLELLKPYGTYWFFCVVMIISFFVVVLTLPETKGKTLEEIEAAFRSGHEPVKKPSEPIVAEVAASGAAPAPPPPAAPSPGPAGAAGGAGAAGAAGAAETMPSPKRHSVPSTHSKLTSPDKATTSPPRKASKTTVSEAAPTEPAPKSPPMHQQDKDGAGGSGGGN
ncbi:solute carrier family 2, facilitated glucose transporter member 8-like [Dermacentor variabilis]|uniref:solute carrier family 2, facilitated glucose transporter member 8-like n=1 Tax=Dermacentor variabilis TaxID=34621 RepID=UPI003F5BD6AE